MANVNFDIMGFLSGNKTFMIVAGLLLYVGIQTLNGGELNEKIVVALLGGGLWTLRLGVKNGSKPPGTPG